jgi:hypothetical protein
MWKRVSTPEIDFDEVDDKMDIDGIVHDHDMEDKIAQLRALLPQKTDEQIRAFISD